MFISRPRCIVAILLCRRYCFWHEGQAGMKLGGGCHCRSIRYQLEWPAGSGLIPARRCGCSFCTRFNGTWTSHPEAKLDMAETASQPATRYRFATGTADFLFCAACGVVVVAILLPAGFSPGAGDDAHLPLRTQMNCQGSSSEHWSDGHTSNQIEICSAFGWPVLAAIRRL